MLEELPHVISLSCILTFAQPYTIANSSKYRAGGMKIESETYLNYWILQIEIWCDASVLKQTKIWERTLTLTKLITMNMQIIDTHGITESFLKSNNFDPGSCIFERFGTRLVSWCSFFFGILSLPTPFSKAHIIAPCTTFPSQALKLLAPAKAKYQYYRYISYLLIDKQLVRIICLFWNGLRGGLVCQITSGFCQEKILGT